MFNNFNRLSAHVQKGKIPQIFRFGFDHDQLRLVGKWKRDLLAKFLRKVSHDFEDWVLDLKPSPPIHVKCFFEPLYLLFSIFYVQMVYDPKEIFRNILKLMC